MVFENDGVEVPILSTKRFLTRPQMSRRELKDLVGSSFYKIDTQNNGFNLNLFELNRLRDSNAGFVQLPPE